MKKQTRMILWIMIAVAALIAIGVLVWQRHGDRTILHDNVYTDTTNEFAIAYPDQWIVSTGLSTNPTLLATITFPNEKEYPVGVNITRDVLLEGQTFDAFVGVAMNALSNQIGNYQLIESGKTNVNGRDARRYTFQGLADNRQYKWDQIYVLENNSVYGITYIALAEDFDAHKDDAEMMFNTFSFK